MLKIITTIASILDTAISLTLAVLGTYFLIKGSLITACILLATHSIWQIPRLMLFKMEKKESEIL